jgi:nucleoside-diphosphate-sugar epimerase
MEADPRKLTIHNSYNVAAISFTARELANEINKHIKVKVTYKPDFHQQIADSWPQSIDDTLARREWGWKHEFTLAKMTEIMIRNLKKKFGSDIMQRI